MTEPRDDAPTPLAKEMGRRDFVKAAAGGVAAVAAGAAAAAMGKGLQRTFRSKVSYLGAKVIKGSPTPWGLPIIPLRFNDEGVVEVVPSNLEAHRVACAGEAPGLDPLWPGDDVVRFLVPPGRLNLPGDEVAQAFPYAAKAGQPVRRTDLAALAVGEGIHFSWRTERPETADGEFRDDALRGILIRIDPALMKGPDVRPLMLKEPPVVAFNSACTHFCCVAGWHEAETAQKFGAWDNIWCTCHNARFDPYTIEWYEFEPETPHLIQLNAVMRKPTLG